MTCLHYRNSRLEHRWMRWLNYITNTSRNKHRGTIHRKYKWIHSEVTITSTEPACIQGKNCSEMYIKTYQKISIKYKQPLHKTIKHSTSIKSIKYIENIFVDVFITLECIRLYILCIVPRCFYREVSVI